jgi:hypothetical protein
MKFENLSDKECIGLLIKNNPEYIVYFFYKKYFRLFAYHICKIFPYQVEIKDYVHDFYLYLQDNEWKNLKTYNPDYKLNTWIGIVSFRFFKNYKFSMIDSRGVITITDRWNNQIKDWKYQVDFSVEKDVVNAIEQIENERDKQIAKSFFIEDKEANDIAKQFNISVDYFYTIKNRIIKKLQNSLKEYKNGKNIYYR